jgi:hypothetical protein
LYTPFYLNVNDGGVSEAADAEADPPALTELETLVLTGPFIVFLDPPKSPISLKHLKIASANAPHQDELWRLFRSATSLSRLHLEWTKGSLERSLAAEDVQMFDSYTLGTFVNLAAQLRSLQLSNPPSPKDWPLELDEDTLADVLAACINLKTLHLSGIKIKDLQGIVELLPEELELAEHRISRKNYPGVTLMRTLKAEPLLNLKRWRIEWLGVQPNLEGMQVWEEAIHERGIELRDCRQFFTGRSSSLRHALSSTKLTVSSSLSRCRLGLSAGSTRRMDDQRIAELVRAPFSRLEAPANLVVSQRVVISIRCSRSEGSGLDESPLKLIQG